MVELENKKFAYQSALQLISYEGALIWSAFTAILAANAFLVTFDSVLLKLFSELRIVGSAISIVGIILCAAWFLVLTRQFSYYRFWFACARSFGRPLSAENNIVELGRTYGEGATVELAGVGFIRMSWIARAFRVQWLANIIISVFAVLYVALLLFFLFPTLSL